jgi:hypothetical protein
MSTIHCLFQHLDDGEFEAVAALFAAEGVWHRMGVPMIGPQGVLVGLRARPSDLSTRHLVTNMVVKEAESGVTARYYVTIFEHKGAVSEAPPIALPHAIFLSTDSLVEAHGGWQFTSRSPKLVFKR